VLPGIYSSWNIPVKNCRELNPTFHKVCEQYIGHLEEVKRKEVKKNAGLLFNNTVVYSCVMEFGIMIWIVKRRDVFGAVVSCRKMCLQDYTYRR
jgi:hypothetical protein